MAGFAAFAMVAAGGSWAFVSSTRFRADLERVRADVASGRFAEARPWLADQFARGTDRPELIYWLGLCEHAAGRHPEAVETWARMPPGSPMATKAALARAQTLIGDLGRYADAEPVLLSALRDARGGDRLEVAQTLAQLVFVESRPDEMRDLIRRSRPDWRDPASELRDLWLVDDAMVMVDEIRQTVEDAERKAPDDDRVQLALAGLDVLAKRFDEASRRLDKCLARHPEDRPTWVARLRLARARQDPDGARAALGHVPADALGMPERLDLRAWLAGARGDDGDRRAALVRRVATAPADPRAFGELAALERDAGRRPRAVELLRRKAELDEARGRYREILTDRVPASGFEELGRLAETLDRPFEAYGWWSLARSLGAGGPDASLALERLRGRVDPPAEASAGTLVDWMDRPLPTAP